MELSWLNTFVIAAQEGDFRKTADRLHLAQSTVTLHIQNIESELQTQLFNRVGRNVQINASGRGFLPYAQNILYRYDESLEYVARARQGYQETIKIAVSTLIATTSLPAWIRAFRHFYPEVEFAITVTDSIDVLESTLSQACDIGIGRMPSLHEQLLCIKLYDDPIVFAVPTCTDGRQSQDVRQILQEYVLFTYNHPLYWDDLLLQLRKVVSHVRTMRVSKVHVSVEWVKEQMGVSFLPYSTVERAVQEGSIELVPFTHFPLPSAHTYLLTSKYPNRTIQKFIEMVSGSSGDSML